MPTTRSATRSLAATPAPGAITKVTKISNPKRRSSEATPSSRKKTRRNVAVNEEPTVSTEQVTSIAETGDRTAERHTPRTSSPQAVLAAEVVLTDDISRHLVPAKLCFSFEEAREHLIKVDHRFEGVFSRLPCKPFEHLEQFDPFNTLTSSILGQQISWKAARSITHRFVRLFNPSLPANPEDYKISDYFPTAQQVVKMDQATLRTAGLSGRKAEYVLDLAARFADGRLTTEKLLSADDEELYDLLIAVRGIGKWTVDMFAIFSLRRPDILPIGDLGVQRGVIRWFLSLHSPSYDIMINPENLPKSSEEEETSNGAEPLNVTRDEDTLPVLGQTSSVQPARSSASKTKGKGKDKKNTSDDNQDTILPTPFTPSVNKILNSRMDSLGEPIEPPPLPIGMTVTSLRARLDPKKKTKGVFLTPKEMEELTDCWRPYRSLGVYYMWALSEDTSS